MLRDRLNSAIFGKRRDESIVEHHQQQKRGRKTVAHFSINVPPLLRRNRDCVSSGACSRLKPFSRGGEEGDLPAPSIGDGEKQKRSFSLEFFFIKLWFIKKEI
ncbi:hypothetical protein CEXT_441041 [Caerostris extrusa]|uniref:Uncharacterized protein n=1 Tax=Caerostris extrusa TaxID=172846 RepID=A0AAV4NGL0_CAEEX|nr:hypothetical protein CEXT_441041 [Caerostris extrusa]